MSKTYIGNRLETGGEVYVEQDGRRYPLPLRSEIFNHSPTGFEWGYGGSGPAQLALAILADHFGPKTIPERCPWCNTEIALGQCAPEPIGCGWKPDPSWLWEDILGGRVHYQSFKRHVVANLPAAWMLSDLEIDAWAEAYLLDHQPKQEVAVIGREDLRAALAESELERERYRMELVHHREKAHGNYWAWQGDGEDHLESLVESCPVMITPSVLAKLLADKATLDALSKEEK